MQIISHRGLWSQAEEKNQRIAFERSFAAGLGTETDLRDLKGEIVISHDMPRGGEMTFKELLELMDGRNLPLALNIKADGQAEEIKRLLAQYGQDNYFTFDMSVPDMVVQIKSGLKVFTGLSDILPCPVLYESAAGIWLDSFNGDWFDEEKLASLLKDGKTVCVVSSDLHRRATDRQWALLKNFTDKANLMLCTDKALAARQYFGI